VGGLFLVSNFTFILGAFIILEPLLGAPDYLNLVSANRTQVILGALLEILNGMAYIGIAALIYPLLKLRFGSLAISYFGFRIIEFVMQTLSDISPLSLLALSEEFTRSGASDEPAFQVLGAILLADRYWAFQMVTLTFGVGALILYTMLYQSRLIPRFISIWGLFGAGFVLVNLVLDLYGLSLGPLENLGFVMLLNELFLGVWLIVKGFDPSAVASLVGERE